MSASGTATKTASAGSLRVGLVLGLALLGCDADPPTPQFDRAARYAEIQAMCAKPDLPRCRPGELIICGTVEDLVWVDWGQVIYSGDTYWLEGPQEEEKTLVGIGVVVDGTPVYSLWERPSTRRCDRFGAVQAPSTRRCHGFWADRAASTRRCDRFGADRAASTPRCDRFGADRAASTPRCHVF
jgi:hypothetical protein